MRRALRPAKVRSHPYDGVKQERVIPKSQPLICGEMKRRRSPGDGGPRRLWRGVRRVPQRVAGRV